MAGMLRRDAADAGSSMRRSLLVVVVVLSAGCRESPAPAVSPTVQGTSFVRRDATAAPVAATQASSTTPNEEVNTENAPTSPEAKPEDDASATAAATPRGPQFSPAVTARADGDQRKPRSRRMRGGYEVVSFDFLGGFPYKKLVVDPDNPKTPPLDQVPAEIKAMDGGRIEIRGFMAPYDLQDGRVSRFFLMGDIIACCYGRPLQPNELIECAAPDGRTFEYHKHVPIMVRGTLRVKEEIENGYVVGLYTLEPDDVIREEDQ